MHYPGLPPEINTSRLMAGAGPAPMLQAAAGWEAFAILLETQADELASSLGTLTSVWSGQAAEQAVNATMPMVLWLRMASLQSHKRSAQALAQAESYSLAMATTPPLAEIELNHVTHAVLEATNFLGVNTVPIGMNEADYFIRMWNLAAGVMLAYAAETTANTLFEPILPPKPIVIPGVTAAAGSLAIGQISAMAPASALREMQMASALASASVQSAQMEVGRMVATGNELATRAEGQVQRTENVAQQASRESQNQTQQGMQQGVQMATQVGSQVGSSLIQLPQQGMQMISQPMQQLTQPLQQMTSLFSSTGSDRAQIGLIGASPFSNHPLAGGTGPSTGAGLVRAASLPGMGGTGARTPVMTNLIGQVENSKPAVGAAAAGPATGLAPVGAGTGGGGGPMGAMGQNAKSGGTRAGLQAPTPLSYDLAEDEENDW